MFKEFKKFAIKGNVIDMAVGIVIGAAFGKIVSSLVADVIMPPIGVLLGAVDFSNLALTLKKATEGTEAVTVNYGMFINTLIDFIIISFAIFIIVKQINKLKIKNHIFVGQAKKNGLGFSQKEQKEILDKFRVGEFNILVATSVAEEGLDIPKVDKVIFYEPIPSAVRSIQRRGRTGRLEEGAVTILVTSGTRDEAYRWSAHHKEKRMYRNLDKLKKEFSLSSLEERQDRQNNGETTLHKYIDEEKVVAVLADHREKDNRVVKDLIDLGVSVKTGQLEVADYLVSGKVAVELKKVPDFVASIIDGRLLEQVRGLKNNFEKAVLIIEGEEDIYSVRKVHANAIRGMLAAIVLDFGVPILYTKSPRDTASLIAVMAKREQDKGGEFSYHPSKPRSMKEQQEFIVSSLPNIGVMNARKLLEHFGSLKNLVNSSKVELIKIDKVGDKIADKLMEMFEKKYEKE